MNIKYCERFQGKVLKSKNKEENVMSKIPKSFVSMIMTALLLASLTAVASADHIPGHLVKTVDYNCDAAVKLFGVPVQQRNFDIQATIEAYDVPSSVNPGQQVTVHNSFATVKVPGDEVLALYNILGWDYISGDVTKFEVKSDNIEQVIDVAPK
ncbi:hypothetical protein [Pueribacillus sp. YX66]|uniref:hypothetical protein n=1 Tax=Pueribacillus sp. YX66 TaxID=3229242 RepID=UPI00358CF888